MAERSYPRSVPVLVALAAGAVFALVFPRGPQDGLSAVATVCGALAAGAVAARTGVAGGRRWLLPGVAWVAAEVVRFPWGAPWADLPVAHLARGSSYALGTAVFGRGIDAALFLLPFAVGVWWGARVRGRRGVASVVAGLLVAGSLGTLVPASTPAIAGGVAEVATVRIGGCDHRLVVRGAAEVNPVVFFLSGGPGGTEIGTLRDTWASIEREFTVVTWDQTGAGVNGRCFPTRERLTLERLLSDGEAALAWANGRFGRKPIVVGNSWGTVLGTLLVARRPDLVSAYVGTGQMVQLTETDAAFYADTVAWLGAHGRAAERDALVAQGPPPYASMYPYEAAFAHEGDWNAWDRDPAISAAVNPVGNVWDKPELDPMAKARYLVNLIETFGVVYPAVQGVDLRRDTGRLDVPVYLAAGTHEARGRAMLVRPWFDTLQAPHKEWVDFPRSGHKAFCEEPDAFLALLRRVAAG